VKRRVQPALSGELGHPQCELRVGDDVRSVVLEASCRETLAKRVLLSEAIPSVELRERYAFGRILRVQVEREPQDVGVELAP
jgi:hypothetical protein